MTRTQEGTDLFAAFGEDHAILGRGFFDLAQSLRANDLEQARAAAARLDRAAGAHIAFEEENFYPALGAFLDADELQRMYDEHRVGTSMMLLRVLRIDHLAGLLVRPSEVAPDVISRC